LSGSPTQLTKEARYRRVRSKRLFGSGEVILAVSTSVHSLRIITGINAGRPVHALVRSHGITSTAASAFHPPFDEPIVSEEEDKLACGFATRIAKNTSNDLVKVIVTRIHEVYMPAAFNVHVIEKFSDLSLT